jgi:hypothetical protein
MIQSLLSKYHNWIGFECQESANYHQNQAIKLAHQRKYADLCMRFFVIGWLFFQLYTYHLTAGRPVILFEPYNWFDRIFMPKFPQIWIWYPIWILTFGLNFLLIFRGENKWARILLGFLILYINCIRWKYEFFSHVGHLLVLYHLLGMFLPRLSKIDAKNSELLDYRKAIIWLNIGIFATYTMAGVWKLIGLVYKLFWHPDHINWLHPLAMKVNSIIGYRDWDENLGILDTLYSVLLPWQIAFWLMLFFQSTSIFGAIKQELTPIYALVNILFHLVNAYLIHIEFFVAPLLLLVLYFPYEKIFRNKSLIQSTNNYENGIYSRIYEDKTTDTYSGFYAWRTFKYEKNSFLWAFLFLPGFSFLMKWVWKK